MSPAQCGLNSYLFSFLYLLIFSCIQQATRPIPVPQPQLLPVAGGLGTPCEADNQAKGKQEQRVLAELTELDWLHGTS